ncbi:ABC transporter permease [Agrobacterium sp. NPDC089420]|uniref:ABC transporter permease n=1 Tax=Agrobacterium sp. NPDC089420 TaxID=3363918 RepID=UPI00384C81DB
MTVASSPQSDRTPLHRSVHKKIGKTLLNWKRLDPITLSAALVLFLVVATAIFAPLIAGQDPVKLDPLLRLKPASAEHWFGMDAYGRDLFSRVVYGTRIALGIGIGAMVASIAIGLVIGLLCGYIRIFDSIVMRIMDGIMAIPAVLLAITIVTLLGAGFWTVLLAIIIPEIPRVVRLVRAVVLSARTEFYIEAAIVLGSRTGRILWKHLVPSTIAPLIVQGSYICASAILTEAVLSFLGAGISPSTPTWGNIIADGRSFFQIKPALIFWPGIMLSATILAINIIGDFMRDVLDPKSNKREAGK